MIVLIALALVVFLTGLAPFLKPAAEIAGNYFAKRLVEHLSPHTYERLWLLASYHFSEGHARKTIKLCEELLERYSDQLDKAHLRNLYAMLGLSYGKIGQPKKELWVYDQLVRVDPSYGHFLTGVAFDSLGQWPEAGRAFSLALESESPDFPLGEMEHQVIQQALGKYKSGIGSSVE